MAHLSHDDETRLISNFFRHGTGFFVEVGANHPRDGSQTWHLEQSGWSGILVEPQPALARQLQAERSARVFAVACSSPENAGQSLPFHVAGPMSSLNRTRMAPGAMAETIIEVPVRTLDDILDDANAPVPLDFLSVDVEDHEIETLSGVDFARWQPRLILLEDHVADRRGVLRKYYLALSFRLLRNFSRGLRQPRKDALARRHRANGVD